MAILNIPLWPFEPNWSSTMTEVLEWLTDIMTSPSGSEQRRSLRYFPRRSFEYSVVAAGGERSLLDNLLSAYGAQRWYFPLWHDTNFIDAPIAVGGSSIACQTVSSSKLAVGSVAMLIGGSAFDTELVQIQTIGDEMLTLSAGVSRAWPAGTRLIPVRVARLTDQPELSKRSDQVVTTEVRFMIVEANADAEPVDPALDLYRGFPVLAVPPDERSALNSGIERMLVDLDNKTSLPLWRDTAARPFTYVQYAWVLQGRDELTAFENLLQSLRGRSQPLWVPTFMDDTFLASTVAAGAGTITIEQCGFTLAGGPRADRQDIMIETLSGRIYRRITASAMDSEGREVLALDAPIMSEIQPAQIVRICFMTLMRQNQDSVTIEHHTDSSGVATALVTFRSAPDTRVPTTAIF